MRLTLTARALRFTVPHAAADMVAMLDPALPLPLNGIADVCMRTTIG